MRNVLITATVALMVFLESCSGNVKVLDWPMSGINPDGNRIVEFSKTGNHAKSDILGWLYTAKSELTSTLAVAQGKLYVGTVDNSIICLDAVDGKLVWETKIDAKPFGTPCVVRSSVFQSTENGFVYCFDANAGKQIWKRELNEEIDIESTADSQRLLVPTRKSLYCLDQESGENVWKVPLEVNYKSLVSMDSDRVYCSSCKDLVCLDAKNGKILWSIRQKRGVYSSPVICKDKVYTCTDAEASDEYDDLKYGSLFCINPVTGKTIWSVEIKIAPAI